MPPLSLSLLLLEAKQQVQQHPIHAHSGRTIQQQMQPKAIVHK